jgi:7-carboxy-7-deazaguanine synthase
LIDIKIFRMSYSVKEIFYSLQGEGARTGRPAVFCRFAACNLWSGEEKHRSAAECNFCDTDFVGTDGVGGGKFASAQALATRLDSYWPEQHRGSPYVVFTGGEPLLQLDGQLIDAMHDQGFEIAVETNGTLLAPAGIDWLCVSPKGQARLLQTTGNELKLVFPQADLNPEDFIDLSFEYFYLQPMEDQNPRNEKQAFDNISQCTDYCLSHPQWKLSLQTHKLLGIR